MVKISVVHQVDGITVSLYWLMVIMSFVPPEEREATALALNKTTGAVVWKTSLPEAGQAHYSSWVVSNGAGKQYLWPTVCWWYLWSRRRRRKGSLEI